MKTTFQDLGLAASLALVSNRRGDHGMSNSLRELRDAADEACVVAHVKVSVFASGFATHSAACSQSECQIQNSTRNLYLLVVLRF